jgi:putative addiction module component (TIGR02574 family)
MTPTMKSLGIDQMPREAQVALVQEIWDNIAAGTSAMPLSEQQRRELDRRLTDDDADPEKVIPWDEVKRKAIERLKR